MRITKDNINEFIGGTSMDCYSMGITKIEFIPEGIKALFCGDNKLTELPKLPESLIHLYCSNNQLTSLPKIPEHLMYIDCSGNNLPYEITIDNVKEHNKLIKRKEILKKICK